MISNRPRRIVLDDGSEVFAHPAAPEVYCGGLCRRYTISRAVAGGRTLGTVQRMHTRNWAAFHREGFAIWEELTGRNWATLTIACERLVQYEDEEPVVVKVAQPPDSIKALMGGETPARRALLPDSTSTGGTLPPGGLT